LPKLHCLLKGQALACVSLRADGRCVTLSWRVVCHLHIPYLMCNPACMLLSTYVYC